MRSLTALVMLLSLLTPVPAAHAAAVVPKTLQDLYTDCKSTNGPRRLQCVSYIEGLGGYMGLLGGLYRSPKSDDIAKAVFAPMSMCAPDRTTIGEWVQAFVNWTEKNPKERTQSKRYGVWIALREAWPCH